MLATKTGKGASFALSARFGLGHLCKNKLPSPACLKEQNLQPFPALWKFFLESFLFFPITIWFYFVQYYNNKYFPLYSKQILLCSKSHLPSKPVGGIFVKFISLIFIFAVCLCFFKQSAADVIASMSKYIGTSEGEGARIISINISTTTKDQTNA